MRHNLSLRMMRDEPTYQGHDIGRYTYGRPVVHSWGEGAKLKIGSFCSLAAAIMLLGGNHRPDWVTTYPFNIFFDEYTKITGCPSTKGDIIIGNDVWIGNQATILSGVEIGDGAVVGINTVVAKSVEPYSIVVGNPGRVVKKRFDDVTIEKLLAIRWWDWDIEKILQNVPVMLSENIAAFVDKHYQP